MTRGAGCKVAVNTEPYLPVIRGRSYHSIKYLIESFQTGKDGGGVALGTGRGCGARSMERCKHWQIEQTEQWGLVNPDLPIPFASATLYRYLW